MNIKFIEKITELTKECLEHQLTDEEKLQLYPIENGIRVDYRKGHKHKNKEFTIPFSAQGIKNYCRSAMTKEELKEYHKNNYEANKDMWKNVYNYDDGNYIYYYKVGKRIVYIGETFGLNQRIEKHMNGKGNWDLYEDYILDNDWEMYVAVLPDEFTKHERRFIEKILIEKYKTKTNKRSNRSHLYLSESRQQELRKLADELEFEKVLWRSEY